MAYDIVIITSNNKSSERKSLENHKHVKRSIWSRWYGIGAKQDDHNHDDNDDDDDTHMYCNTIKNKTENENKKIVYEVKHKLYLFKVRVLKANRY